MVPTALMALRVLTAQTVLMVPTALMPQYPQVTAAPAIQ
jgi:hypothetical protein